MRRILTIVMTAILLSAIWCQKPVNAAQQETNITKEASAEAITEQVEKNTTKKKKNDIAYCYYGTIAYKKVNGVKVAFLGYNQLSGVTKQQVKAGIAQAKKKKAQIIIVSFGK